MVLAPESLGSSGKPELPPALPCKLTTLTLNVSFNELAAGRGGRSREGGARTRTQTGCSTTVSSN